jgi:excisionase family DNA binding protein
MDGGVVGRPKGEPMPLDRDVLTTGEVAKICNVAPRTVSKWFDSGQLKGYRIPGSKDRRIPVSELVRFMKEHGIPLDGVVSGSLRVLIVDDDQEVVDVLRRVLTEQTDYEIATATGSFQAGLDVRADPPARRPDQHPHGRRNDGRGDRRPDPLRARAPSSPASSA